MGNPLPPPSPSFLPHALHAGYSEQARMLVLLCYAQHLTQGDVSLRPWLGGCSVGLSEETIQSIIQLFTSNKEILNKSR